MIIISAGTFWRGRVGCMHIFHYFQSHTCTHFIWLIACVPEDCPEGQVLDEESGICVLEEMQSSEQPEEQSQAEEVD
jgi:hypothetical protein